MISDLRFAVRHLLKRPGFAAVAVLTLALGIGVNTTMFSVLNAFVLQTSAAPDSGRLVSAFGTSSQSQNRYFSPANYYDYEKQTTLFSDLAAYDNSSFNLAQPGNPAERLPGMSVSGNFFKVFGIPPAVGNVFGPESDKYGVTQVAVISDGFWRSHYAGDPGVLGKTLRLDGDQVTIVGVMPPEFDNETLWGRVDLWRPLAFNGGARNVRDNNWLSIIGRLRRGATLAQAASEASAIGARLARDFPQANAGTGIRLDLWNHVRTDEVSRRISWLCMALAGFVLLIACANLANLQLARMSERVREHAVRIALGATRSQLIRQLLVESLVLSAAGGTIGVLLASWGTRLIGAEINIGGVDGFALPINLRVLAFTLAASIATGIGVGTIPAWIASRTDVSSALKQGSRGSTTDRSRHLFRQALIVCELALALILLSGAGYFVRGMQRLAHANMGWKPGGLTTANLVLPYNASYASDAQCRAFYDKLEASLSSLPGTQEATVATYLPVTGFWRNAGVLVEGRPRPAHGSEPLFLYNSVSPGFFRTLGIRVERGRAFAASDRGGSRRVAVINETMARALWPDGNPIGARIEDADPAQGQWLEVVGVVNDVESTIDFIQPPAARFQVYIPLAQTPSGFAHWLNVAIRSEAPGPTLSTALRAAMLNIDPDQPISAVVSAPESIEQMMRGFTLTGELLSVFSLVGLVLSAVGIYGVIANLVAQRTSEIGIRMALGAQTRDVLWLVLGQGVRLSILGTAVGLACAWGLIRLLASVIPGIPGGDPIALGFLVALLGGVAMFASWLPARRATKVDPIIALRTE